MRHLLTPLQHSCRRKKGLSNFKLNKHSLKLYNALNVSLPLYHFPHLLSPSISLCLSKAIWFSSTSPVSNLLMLSFAPIHRSHTPECPSSPPPPTLPTTLQSSATPASSTATKAKPPKPPSSSAPTTAPASPPGSSATLRTQRSGRGSFYISYLSDADRALLTR